MFAYLERKWRFSLIYPITGFFRDTDSLHLDTLDDWTRQRLPVFRLRCACQQGKFIDEILRLARHKDAG
jgi:hypothetical protein